MRPGFLIPPGKAGDCRPCETSVYAIIRGEKMRRRICMHATDTGGKAFLLRSADSCPFRRLRQGFPDDPVRKAMFPPWVPYGDQCRWSRAGWHRGRLLQFQEEEGP